MVRFALLCIAVLAVVARAQYQLGGGGGGETTAPEPTAETIPAQIAETEDTAPGPTPAEPVVVADVAPVVTPPQPIAAETPIVTAAELASAKELIESIYNLGGTTIKECDSSKLVSDYYALSVVNCDRVQREVQASGEQLLECPQQCSMGVTHVGPECTAAFNIRYIRNQSASYGAEFTMKQYDPLGAAGLCGVDLSVDAKAGAFAAGHMQYLVNMLQKSNTKVTGCDTGKLTSASFVDAKVKCAAAIAGDASSGACNSDCEAAVVAAGGITCMQNLSKAAETADAVLYDATLKQFEPCLVEAAAPVPELADDDDAKPTTTTPPPTSNAARSTAISAIAAAAMMLVLL